MDETVINLNDERTLFSSDKGLVGQLKRMGLTVKKSNDYGTWFDLSEATLTVKIKRKRGIGQKEMELN